MSQHDFNIANQTFPSFRSDLNDALQAAATMSAGSSAPTTPYAYQLWFDTATDTWKVRNSGNTAWISTITTDLATGNVGIGTSPLAKFHVNNTNSAFYMGYGGNEDIYLQTTNGNVLVTNKAATTERMRIDSSGNLLVGTTTGGGTIGTYNGFGAFAGGSIFSAATSNRSIFSRRSTDGSIIEFRKDGSTVGSIGVANNDIPYITCAEGTSGLRFDGDNSNIKPSNASGANLDAVISLGSGGTRFTDLYLSGGVYLGGTSSANYLDDYEEGTFNLSVGGTATYTANTGRYVKIGGLVHIVFDFQINTIGTGSQSVISGLPYAAFNTTPGSIGYYSGLFAAPVYPTFYITNISTIQFAWNTSASSIIQNNGNNILTNGSRVIGSSTYWVS